MSGAPVIQSPGPPPERHAARVVGEMCRWLAGEQWRINALLKEYMAAEARRGGTRLGNPKAQRRFAERLVMHAGSRGLIDIKLTPGKRGHYALLVAYWALAAPGAETPLWQDDPIPERPWLTCVAELRAPKDPELERITRPVTLTHHAMQRLAERCGARTTDDLLAALRQLWLALEKTGEVPDRSLRIPVAGGLAIAKQTAEYGWLVKTVVKESIPPT